MLAALSACTSSMLRFSRRARPESIKWVRSVAMRPGKTMLHVTPSGPTSRDEVLDHPTSDSLRALDIARLGIGATTPDEVEVIIRPQRRALMPGRTRSVIAITERTIALNCSAHSLGSCPAADVGGGPPVLLTRISTGPRVLSASAIWASTRPISARSQVMPWAMLPNAATAAMEVASASGAMSARATFTPSPASASAMARPSPPPPPSTSAVFPFIPKSILGPHWRKDSQHRPDSKQSGKYKNGNERRHLSKSNRRERIKFRSGVLGRLVDNCCSWDRGLAYPRVLRAGG